VMQAGAQVLHLTGVRDFEKIQAAYKDLGYQGLVRPFLTEMDFALGAATVAVSRAGASSLAELAAMRLPSILIPYPTAADNHQYHNARAFAETGAARMMEQKEMTAKKLSHEILRIVRSPKVHSAMALALDQWHYPDAARSIARTILATIQPCEVSRD